MLFVYGPSPEINRRVDSCIQRMKPVASFVCLWAKPWDKQTRRLMHPKDEARGNRCLLWAKPGDEQTHRLIHPKDGASKGYEPLSVYGPGPGINRLTDSCMQLSIHACRLGVFETLRKLCLSPNTHSVDLVLEHHRRQKDKLRGQTAGLDPLPWVEEFSFQRVRQGTGQGNKRGVQSLKVSQRFRVVKPGPFHRGFGLLNLDRQECLGF